MPWLLPPLCQLISLLLTTRNTCWSMEGSLSIIPHLLHLQQVCFTPPSPSPSNNYVTHALNSTRIMGAASGIGSVVGNRTAIIAARATRQASWVLRIDRESSRKCREWRLRLSKALCFGQGALLLAIECPRLRRYRPHRHLKKGTQKASGADASILRTGEGPDQGHQHAHLSPMYVI